MKTISKTYFDTRRISGVEGASCESREEWLQERTKGIGGSDVASILGRGFSSALTVWRSKRGVLTAAERERSEAFGASEKAEFGHRMEDLAAAMYSERSGSRVERLPADSILWRADSPWKRASLDRLVFSGQGTGVLEIKNVDASQGVEWVSGTIGDGPEDMGKAPRKYLDQLLWYLHVTGLEWGALVAVVGGCSLRVVELRDREWVLREIRNISASVHDFWQMVLAGDMPFLLGTELDQKALADRDVIDDLRVEMTGTVVEQGLLARLMDAKERMKRTEREYDAIKVELQERMGGPETTAKELWCMGSKVAEYRNGERISVDHRRLEAEWPDAYRECASKKGFRGFYVTLKEGR